MVDLPPRHALSAITQRPPVVAGPDQHDLRDTSADRIDYDPIEEDGPGAQVLLDQTARRRGAIHGHVAGERIVGGGIAEAGGRAEEGDPVCGHPLGGQRGLTVTHRSNPYEPDRRAPVALPPLDRGRLRVRALLRGAPWPTGSASPQPPRGWSAGRSGVVGRPGRSNARGSRG